MVIFSLIRSISSFEIFQNFPTGQWPCNRHSLGNSALYNHISTNHNFIYSRQSIATVYIFRENFFHFLLHLVRNCSFLIHSFISAILCGCHFSCIIVIVFYIVQRTTGPYRIFFRLLNLENHSFSSLCRA